MGALSLSSAWLRVERLELSDAVDLDAGGRLGTEDPDCGAASSGASDSDSCSLAFRDACSAADESSSSESSESSDSSDGSKLG